MLRVLRRVSVVMFTEAAASDVAWWRNGGGSRSVVVGWAGNCTVAVPPVSVKWSAVAGGAGCDVARPVAFMDAALVSWWLVVEEVAVSTARV